MNNNDMKLLIMVVNAGLSDEVMDLAREAGLKGATILSARGENANLVKVMGITVDTEKDMIMSITEEDTAEAVMEAVKEKAGFLTEAHAFCFTMPVDKVIGLNR